MAPNPFYPVMTHFTLPLHATRAELIALAAAWAGEHELHVSIERYHPRYQPVALDVGADLPASIEAVEPVRRICLGRDGFDVLATSDIEHLTRNPNSFAMVLEPLTEDGLRATALTGRMGDEDVLRWWIERAREAAAGMHWGAYAVDREHGRRIRFDHHIHTTGAHELAVRGVPMLAATGSAIFEFDDVG